MRRKQVELLPTRANPLTRIRCDYITERRNLQLNIMIYQNPDSMWAEEHRRCEECALLGECPMWAKGKFSDLRASNVNPGFCTYWRPLRTGEGYCPPSSCADCRWNKDGVCQRLSQEASEDGWPMWVRVHDGNSACSGFEDRPALMELDEDIEPKPETDMLPAEAVTSGTAMAEPNFQTSGNLMVLTAEVNMLAAQMAQHALLIGRKLKEIKELLPHGEFMPYIEANCGFKKSLANQFMRIATEYTVETLPSGLSVSKVYELLALPAEQREEFIATHDVENATVRQLREEIRQAKQAAEEAEQDRELMQVRYDSVREQLAYSDDQLRNARAALARQTAVTLDLGDKLRCSQGERSQLAQQLNAVQAVLENRKTETVTVEVMKEVPPPDYEAYRQENAELHARLRELERPAASLESIAYDVLGRWEQLVEELEEVQRQTASVMSRNKERAKVDADRCTWLSDVVSAWEGYVAEMHAHFTRLFAEAVADGE